MVGWVKCAFQCRAQKVRYLARCLQKRCLSAATTKNFEGNFPALPAIFKDDGSVDFDQIAANFEKWEKVPYAGYLVHGTNGESAHLNTEEKIEIVKYVKNIISKDKVLLVGTGRDTTQDTIDLSEKCAKAGADAVLVLPPYFYKNRMSQEAVKLHYQNVAKSVSVPVILYNNPANSGIELEASTVSELAQHHNIMGIKESTPNIAKISYLVHLTKEQDFKVFAGSASCVLPGLLTGCVGAFTALSVVLGNELCLLDQLCRQKKYEEALQLHQRLIEPTLVLARYGVPGLKTILEHFGMKCGPCRPPLTPLSKVEAEDLKNAFKRAGFTKM